MQIKIKIMEARLPHAWDLILKTCLNFSTQELLFLVNTRRRRRNKVWASIDVMSNSDNCIQRITSRAWALILFTSFIADTGLQGLPRLILNQRRGEIFIVWLREGILIEGEKRTWKIKIRGARSEADTRATSRRQNNRRDQRGQPENACESVVILWILSNFSF